MKYSISTAVLAAALPFTLAAPTPEAGAAASKAASAPQAFPVDTSVYLTAARHAIHGNPSTSAAKRSTLYGWTANELSKCAPVTVIFARGTTEFGNIGETTGPFFADALAARLGSNNVGVQGVLPYSYVHP
jgi:cutinase